MVYGFYEGSTKIAKYPHTSLRVQFYFKMKDKEINRLNQTDD